MQLEISNILISPGDQHKDEYFVSAFRIAFDLELPYTVSYTSSFEIQERVANSARDLHLWPYIVFHLLSFTSSLLLLLASLRVIRHIIYISRVVTRPETLNRDKEIIVLDFNHCRFIGKSTFQKKLKHSYAFFEVLEHIKALNINFFFSCLHYMLNIGFFFVAMKDVLSTGVISDLQLLLLAVNSFLDCADVSTIFAYDSKYNLLRILFDKHTRDIFIFLSGSVIFFYVVTFIMFSFYQNDQNLGSLTNCVSYIFALMLGDSVLDVFKEMEHPFGKLFIFGIVFVFHLTFLQIFMGLMASSFQKTKAEFEKVEQLKAEQTRRLLEESKAGIKHFKSANNTEVTLKEEFMQKYKSRLKQNRAKAMVGQMQHVKVREQPQPSNSKEPAPDSRGDRISPENQPSGIPLKKEPSNSLDESNLKQDLNREVTDELAHFLFRRVRKHSEGLVQPFEHFNAETLSEFDVSEHTTQIDQAIKSLTFEIAILVKYNFDLLKKYFTEFAHLKNKQKFSFILVIASSELCDNLLYNLKRLKTKINRISP